MTINSNNITRYEKILLIILSFIVASGIVSAPFYLMENFLIEPGSSPLGAPLYACLIHIGYIAGHVIFVFLVFVAIKRKTIELTKYLTIILLSIFLSAFILLLLFLLGAPLAINYIPNVYLLEISSMLKGIRDFFSEIPKLLWIALSLIVIIIFYNVTKLKSNAK